MKLSDLQVGIKLELEIYNHMGERTGIPLISQFEGAENENTAYIATPIYQGNLYPLSIGSFINLIFIHNGELYKFTAKVVDRYMKQNLSFTKIEVITKIGRVQRRRFYRLKCLLPIEYRLLGKNKDEADEFIEFHNGYVKDISGGGVCITVYETIELNEMLECILTLNKSTKIKFIGEAIRVNRYNVDGDYKYEIGISYKKIDHKDREKIISYIFEEQKILRRKGLI